MVQKIDLSADYRKIESYDMKRSLGFVQYYRTTSPKLYKLTEAMKCAHDPLHPFYNSKKQKAMRQYPDDVWVIVEASRLVLGKDVKQDKNDTLDRMTSQGITQE